MPNTTTTPRQLAEQILDDVAVPSVLAQAHHIAESAGEWVRSDTDPDLLQLVGAPYGHSRDHIWMEVYVDDQDFAITSPDFEHY
jgi:hypothetical protein